MGALGCRKDADIMVTNNNVKTGLHLDVTKNIDILMMEAFLDMTDLFSDLLQCIHFSFHYVE